MNKLIRSVTGICLSVSAILMGPSAANAQGTICPTPTVTVSNINAPFCPEGDVRLTGPVGGRFVSTYVRGVPSNFTPLDNIAVDASGNIYIPDIQARTLQKITPDGVLTTIVGNGFGSYPQGTIGFSPHEIGFDSAGKMYALEGINIVTITPEGLVTRIAVGNHHGFGAEPFSPSDTNRMYMPSGIDVDRAGNVYYADYANGKISKITPAGVVTLIAGSSIGYEDGPVSTAKFGNMRDVVLGDAGNLYVIDGVRVRKITPEGMVSTLAGSGVTGDVTGAGTAASFSNPLFITYSNGSLYLVDQGNLKVKKITLDGVVSDYAGITFPPMGNYDDGPVTVATFKYPYGIAHDNEGNLFVSELRHGAIRKVTEYAPIDYYIWSNGESLQSTGPIIESGTYTLQTVSGTCTSAPSLPVVVTVNPAVVRPSITSSGPLRFCAGDSVILTSPSATGNLWNTGETGQSITVTDAGRYYVSVITGTCTSTSAYQSVVVDSLPHNAIGISGSPFTVYPGASYTYGTQELSGITSYIWRFTGIATLIPDNNRVTVSFDSGATSGTLSARGVNDCGEGRAINVRLTLVAPVGTLHGAQHQISISPNPGRETFTLQAESDMQNLEVLDNTGRTVHRQSISGKTATFNLVVPAGIYTARIATGRGVSVCRLLIK
ncbi:MAG: T9SS type A sorting domain-containing protein [Bacteroidota bacterium]